MAYTKQNKAHSNHYITKPDGSTASRYSRYETGRITGRYREIPAVLADSTGFDSLGFDSSVGSVDDRWHVVNVFDSVNTYIDSIAVGGAMDGNHALQIAKSQLDSLGGTTCQLITNNAMQFDGMDHDHAWSIDAINKLMDNPSQNKSYLPVITAPELVVEAERVTFDSVQWDSNNNLISHGGKDSRLYLDLTRADTRNELVTEFDLADALFDMDAQEAGFDALMDTKSRLPLLKDRLFKALSQAGDESLSVTNVTQTKEFKRQGVINIAFVFDLSDGQKLSIWFHKPLESSSKLLPSDYMVSWKWMLNKRDVTAALSPKHGDNVQLPALARRIMRVAAKNSKRFKAAQARKAKVEQELLDAEQAIEDKKATISQLDADIADINAKIDAAMKAPDSDTVNESGLQADEPADAPVSTTAATAIPVREALEYVKANIFEGKDDQVLMYVTDRSTGEIKETKLVKASSKSAQTRWSNNFVNDDTTGSVYNQSIPKTNSNAATLLEDLGYKINYADPEGFIDDQFKVGDAYRFIDPNDANDTGSVLEFKSWEGINRGNDEPILSFSSFSGASGKSFKLSEMQKLVADGAAVLVTDSEAQEAKDFETEQPVSVYVNSKGRELVTVTYSHGQYNLKGSGFMNGADDEAGVLKILRSIRKDNKSMKLKEGKEFFPAGDDGKEYPPLEYDAESKTVTAYMNSKKKDSWTAIPKDDGGFTVYADNAQTRAYRTSAPKMFDNSEDLIATYPAFRGIDALLAKHSTSSDDVDYAEIDESEYPELFLDRNSDKLNILGIGDDNIHVGNQNHGEDSYSDLYHIDTGIFKDMTLNFTDAVCKVVDASIDIGADAVVGDYTATAYQDSMFDDLNSKSNPTYGITVQISKDGAYLRAEVDAYGEAKILKGMSGQDVVATVKHVFTDNTGEYKTAIENALDAQADQDMDDKKADDDMSTTDTHDVPNTAETAPAANISNSGIPDITNADKSNALEYGEKLLDFARASWVPSKSYDDIDEWTSEEQTAAYRKEKELVEAEFKEVIRLFGVLKQYRAYKKDQQEIQEMANLANRAYLSGWRGNPSKGSEMNRFFSAVDRRKQMEIYNETKEWNAVSEDHVFPPVEKIGDDEYRAYRDSDKKDHWTAKHVRSGDWEVVIDTERSRNIKGVSTLRLFNSIDDIINEYPAFKGVKEIIAGNDKTKKDDTLDDPDALFAAFFNEFYDEVMNSQRPKIQGLRLSANAVDGTNISFESGNGKSYKILGSEYNPSGKNVNLNLIEVKANGAGYTSQNSMISIVASTKVTKNSDWMESLRSKKEWLISEVFDVLDIDYQEKNKADTVAEPATSAAAKRINEIEQQMSAADFDPMTVDTDELIDLVDQVEGDVELSAKLDYLSTTLQQKIVAVSMKALTDMAGA
tara:strand:- start:1012 stop:5196 length:4185 start_codon:yes stop_codon:yes gene_type:complete